MIAFRKITIACCVLAALAGCKETSEERMAREAAETNSQCPKMIDELTRLDSLKFVKSSKSFHYYYAIKGSSDSILSSLLANPENKERTTQQLINQSDLRFYIEHRLSFHYHFYSMESHKLLGSIEVRPEDYQKFLKH